MGFFFFFRPHLGLPGFWIMKHCWTMSRYDELLHCKEISTTYNLMDCMLIRRVYYGTVGQMSDHVTTHACLLFGKAKCLNSDMWYRFSVIIRPCTICKGHLTLMSCIYTQLHPFTPVYIHIGDNIYMPVREVSRSNFTRICDRLPQICPRVFILIQAMQPFQI